MLKWGLLTPWRDDAPRPLEAPAPLARPQARPHHWLTVHVGLRLEGDLQPLGAAQVVVRPMPVGQVREGDPIARGSTGADGSVALLLPAGRYTVTAVHGPAKRRVLVTVERAGRVTLVLEDGASRHATLSVEARAHDGGPAQGVPIEARVPRSGKVAARGVTDDRGAAALFVPHGEYDVVAQGASVRQRVAGDADVQLVLPPPPPTPPSLPYLRRVRAANAFAAPFDPEAVDGDLWN